MIIKNVKVYTEEQKFVPGEIVVLGDRITEVRADGKKRQTAAEALETESSVNGFSEAEEAEEVVVDGEGAYAIPGLIDLHFHGCVGADVCDGTPEALKKIAQYEASVGVTAIAPATMTLPVEELEAPVSILVSVSKRRFKRAVKRNRVKRQIREAYRMNKHGLLAVLTEKKCRLAVAFIYLSDQLVDSSVIEDRMKTALARIAEKVAANAETEQTPQVS